jgi:hypothetical protein
MPGGHDRRDFQPNLICMWLNTVEFVHRANGLPVRSPPLDERYDKKLATTFS